MTMGRLGLIAGSSLRGVELPEGGWMALQRHGEAASYVLPHRIDHVANLRALADAGCDRVLGVGSVGGLRAELGPGTIVVPDDFIALDAPPLTGLEGEAAHRVAGFDGRLRSRLLETMAEVDAQARESGVYWQATGPRLETPAEIRLIAAHADVIGMTLASECAAACEQGIGYAAVCVVDNLANGVDGERLEMAELVAARERNRTRLRSLLERILPRLARR